MSDNTPDPVDIAPEPTEPEVPEVIAHADEAESYPCSGNCTQMAAD